MSEDKKYSDVVVIGGVATGPKTAATLARRDGNLIITLFQREKILSYGSCGLPYFASGDIDNLKELTSTSYGVVRGERFFRNSKGFEAVTGAEVVSIDRENKTVAVKIIETDEIVEHGYKYLVIATGARPTPPPFPVAASDKIRNFTRPDDAVAFRKMAQSGQIGKAVVIGGGFIGCELAETCGGLWGIETVLIEKENQILPFVLDPEMAEIAQRELARQDIDIRIDTTVEKIELDDNGNPLVYINNNNPISADYVFLSLGVTPEISLARECGLEIGTTGAIKVNNHLQTSDPDIYAGGDCIESINQLTGQPVYIPMGSLANRHGRVIAENITGNETEFPGVLGAFLVKLFDANVGAVGLSVGTAKKNGIDADAVWGTFPDKPDYYPEGKTFTAKLVYETKTGRALGMQAVGRGDICRRIDSLSALLQSKAKLDNLLSFEHGYAPPYSEALDPIHHLAGMAQAKINGCQFIPPQINIDKSDILWLDVREVHEVESEPWPHKDMDDFLAIPLDDLRQRIVEIDKSKTIIIVCKRGPRAYQAAVILNQIGFKNVSVLSGGYEAALQ